MAQIKIGTDVADSPVSITGNKAAGSTDTADVVITSAVTRTGAAKLASIQNNTVEKVYATQDGIVGLTSLLVSGHSVQYGTAAPITGTWAQGDIVYNSTPTAGGNIGWVCTTGGTSGTWYEFGEIMSIPVVETIITTGDMSLASLTSTTVDKTLYEHISFECVSTGAPVGTLTAQVSTDNSNWATIGTAAVTAAGTVYMEFPFTVANYVQVIYTKTSGTGSLTVQSTKRR